MTQITVKEAKHSKKKMQTVEKKNTSENGF